MARRDEDVRQISDLYNARVDGNTSVSDRNSRTNLALVGAVSTAGILGYGFVKMATSGSMTGARFLGMRVKAQGITLAVICGSAFAAHLMKTYYPQEQN